MNPQMMQWLAAVNQQTPGVPAQPQVNGVAITGAIVQFENSEPKIGDVNLRAVPGHIEWTLAKTKAGVEYLRSKNEFSAIAHIGEHGRVWGDQVVDTGNVSSQLAANASFQDRIAALKGKTVQSADDDGSL